LQKSANIEYRITNIEVRSLPVLLELRNASAHNAIRQLLLPIGAIVSITSDFDIRYSLLEKARGIGTASFMERQPHLCPDSAAFYFQQFSLSKFAILERIWTAVM
jgi:hypothetical protein